MAKSGGKPSKLKNGRWRARIPVGRNEDGELKYRNVTAKTEDECWERLKTLIEEGLIFKNPADGCRLPPKVHGKITILTHDELYRLLVQAKYDGMFEMLFLDITTGLRRGELVALKWSDLNIHKAELNVSRQYTRINGEMVISNPKTPKLFTEKY